ncbi:heterogeneous nuclear ribonucleoprotein A1-like [Culex pipiens pallens]|uniref:heterogeneous nuclear ribonucleoprotein A1-like n=1 Tax=Culex pipiens pallens TaxID=42434 RepID=UPI001953811F|nr:heterogeneous nuclear ribonucleoprotein A1-like [Culex pipiens pallens]
MWNGGRGRGGNYQGLPKYAGNGPENWGDENWGAENWTGNSYESWDTGRGRDETENWGGNGRWNEDWHDGRGWSGEVGCANGSGGRGWNDGRWNGGRWNWSHRGRGRGFRGGFRGGRGSYSYNADRPEKEGKTMATQTKACLFGEKATQTDLTFGEAENEDGNDWVTVLRRNQNRIDAANNTPNNNAGKNGNNKDFREFLDDP